TVFHLFFGARFEGDAELMAQLKKAVIPEPKTPARLVGQWPQWRGPNRDGLSEEKGWATTWPGTCPKVLWTNNAPGRYSCPAVANGRLYTMLRDGNKEVVICWDAETGKTKWSFPYPASYDSGDHRVADYSEGPRSTPTVDGKHVYTVGATG